MISQQKKFLFVHIPKTGGNSLQSILIKYSEDKKVISSPHQDGEQRFEISSDRFSYHKHSPISVYRQELDPALYASLFKFTIIRNPWERLISYYFSPHRGVTDWKRSDFIKLVLRTPGINFYLLPLGYVGKKICRFSGFAMGKLGKNSEMDFYIRYEQMEQDFKSLCQQIGVEYEQLPRLNQSRSRNYTDYYDSFTKDLVYRKYRDEINFFKYNY